MSTEDNLVNALRALNGVISVEYSSNFGNLTDEQGLPPRYIELTIDGGNDFEIAKTIDEIKPVGVAIVGNTVVLVDNVSYKTCIRFSRPSKQEINK